MLRPMLAQPLIEAALTFIFVKMRTIYNLSVAKRQRDFLAELSRCITQNFHADFVAELSR